MTLDMIYDQSSVEATFVADAHVDLAILANLAMNKLDMPLAYIVSPVALTLLISASQSSFAGPAKFERVEGSKQVGSLNGWPVFLDASISDDTGIKAVGFSDTFALDVIAIGINTETVSFI